MRFVDDYGPGVPLEERYGLHKLVTFFTRPEL